jgi:UDP-glucose 4-epimerase
MRKKCFSVYLPFMSEKIIVTGGAGFIGSHTVVELFQAGYEPVIIDNFSNSQRFIIERIEKICGSNIKFYETDCRDSVAMNQIMADEKPYGIIHFAAFKSVNDSLANPELYYDNNVNSLLVVLESMKKNGIKNLVFSSSCTVYGNPSEIPVTENSTLNKPTSPYGETKVIGEEKINEFAKQNKDFHSVILRYFNPVGAHSSGLIGEIPSGVPTNLVPYITQTAAGWREQITVNGNDYSTSDGTCIRDYIHVVDLAKAHVAAIKFMENNQSEIPVIYNLGTGNGVSILEAIQSFEKVNGIKLPYCFGPRREGDVEKIYASVEKANRELHWECKHGIDDAMKHAWKWQQTLQKPE